jgi:apolipoprotein N-acyltransferase
VGVLKMAIVQGGLPTWVYTRAERDKAAEQPEDIYARLTRDAPPATLTIWPETSVWRFWGSDADWMQRLDDLARARGGLLVGTPRRDRGQGLHNSAILLGDGAPRVIDKERLALNAEAGFIPGLPHGPTSWRDIPLGIIFCLETVIPDYAAQQTRDGARAIIALVEGSRFGGTPVGLMHARRSRVRAMETGRAVAHAGQHGYTMVAWPDGTASTSLAPFTADTLIEDVPLYTGTTPFTSLGLWSLMPFWIVLVLALTRRIHMHFS